MTVLLDRGAFRAQLDAALHHAVRQGEQVAVLYLLLAPRLGAETSRDPGQRLAELSRRSDRIGRLAQGEYAVMLQGRDLQFEPARTAERLLEGIGLARDGDKDSGESRTRAWIGIAVYPRDSADTESLLADAAEAAVAARSSGHEHYRFCGWAMSDAEARGLAIAERLRTALDRNGFSVHFQPRVAAEDGRILGAEALLRWWDPELGLVPPAEFVPIAERLGKMDPIGTWVMEQACTGSASWAGAGFSHVRISVNVSAHQIESGSLRDAVARALADTALRPDRLEIELTESVLLDTEDQAVLLLREFADLGITLALDDFGTGYSSLGYLRRFPVSTLKIDASFVREIRAGEPFPPFVDGILALARCLGLSVVAEGVENEAQRAALLERGCLEMQGHLFGPPLPVAAFLARLEGDSGRRAVR